MMTKTQRTGSGLAAAMLALAVVPVTMAARTAEAAQRRPAIRRPAVDNWVRLGSKRVDGRRDRDSIDVSDRGKFRALMFRVTNSPARIKNVVVHFENGKDYRAQVREAFARGERSSRIDLPGDRRNVDRVTFNYTDLRGRQNAEVVLFGMR
jgi:hypothetical protein